jgi:glycosyltransferase involved in cell wall biosynthesis
MRVLHVDSARSWRGGQNQVLLSAQGMAERGHEVVLACQAGSILETRAREAGLSPTPLSFRGDLGPQAALGLLRLVKAFRPGVVHVHDPHAASAGLVATRLAGGPRPIASRRVDFELRGWASRFKYRTCRGVLAASEAIRAVLLRGGMDARKVRVVYEGVPDRPAEPGGEEMLHSLGVPKGSLTIGNVAQLTDHKDHATLLSAFSEAQRTLPALFLVIVGDGELRPKLEAQARALGIQDRVCFAGFRTDLDRLLPAFTLFCLSSRLEGLGTSLLDAMSHGRAIVATGAGGIPEAVQDGVTGRLSPPGDPKALARSLVEVLQDESLRESFGRAGRRRFLEHFTADRMVERTLEEYAALP